MIDTLIYDMGNVLVRWDPHALAQAGSSDPADAALLEKALFGHPDWIKGDLGAYDEESMYRAALGRVPARLASNLKRLCFEWPRWVTPLPGADAFVRRAYAAGLRGYLLSNASSRYPQALFDCFPAFDLFNGWVVSAYEGMVKPDERIFQLLLDRYDLAPQNCFFIDDMAANVEAARRAGLDGCVFEGDFEALVRLLEGRGVRL